MPPVVAGVSDDAAGTREESKILPAVTLGASALSTRFDAHGVPVPEHETPEYRQSVYGCAPATGGEVPFLSFVHHVTVVVAPPLVGQ